MCLMQAKKSSKATAEAPVSDYERGFERCVVTFIDILGYRALLNTRHAEDIAKAVRALRKFTAGDANDGEAPSRMDEVRLYTQSFSESVSDAVVRVRTVDTQSQDGPFVYELIDLVMATIELVNQGILIRGGLTIGPAHIGLDGKGPIFGNAMVRAFEIEEHEATYPRIMIDEAAVDAYLTDQTLWQDHRFTGFEAKIAQGYIAVADDGSLFLDYLRGADPGLFDAGDAGRFQFLQRHRDLIVDGLAVPDARVRRKFAWLANYHNRFIAELREQYDMNDPSGEFAEEIGVAPSSLFDGLVIRGSWDDVAAKLASIVAEDAD